MIYPKNVPNWERIIRIVTGIVLVGLAVFRQSQGQSGVILFLILAAFVVVTGFVGWCPACALIGRKIKQQQSK